jgi:hypothetical protein
LRGIPIGRSPIAIVVIVVLVGVQCKVLLLIDLIAQSSVPTDVEHDEED